MCSILTADADTFAEPDRGVDSRLACVDRKLATVWITDADAVDEMLISVHGGARPHHTACDGPIDARGRVHDGLAARGHQVGAQVVACSPTVDVRRRHG